MGFAVRLPIIGIQQVPGSLGFNLSGSVKGLTSHDVSQDGMLLPYPIPLNDWDFQSIRGACELTWSPNIRRTGTSQAGTQGALRSVQFRTRLGYTGYPEKDGIWDISGSLTSRFRQSRLSLRAESTELPEKWNWTISWNMEK